MANANVVCEGTSIVVCEGTSIVVCEGTSMIPDEKRFIRADTLLSQESHLNSFFFELNLLSGNQACCGTLMS